MFFNIGLAEIAVIAVLGLLVFGPDRLPGAVRSLVAGARHLRDSARDATASLQDAAGWDAEDTRRTMDDIAGLHPKRLMGSILDDATTPRQAPNGARRSGSTAVPSASPPPALHDFDPDAP